MKCYICKGLGKIAKVIPADWVNMRCLRLLFSECKRCFATGKIKFKEWLFREKGNNDEDMRKT